MSYFLLVIGMAFSTRGYSAFRTIPEALLILPTSFVSQVFLGYCFHRGCNLMGLLALALSMLIWLS